MYNTLSNITNDGFATMTGKVPDPLYVADILCGLYKEANKLSEIYKLMTTEYESENDFYTLLSDISDVMDEVDTETLTMLRVAYGTGLIYSKAERWIMVPLFALYDDTNDLTLEASLITQIQKIIDDCEYITTEDMQIYAADLYRCIAAMYLEIYNTYELDRWIRYKKDKFPFIDDVTRGFNEFLVRENKSVEEMADIIYEATQNYVLVTNEVDRNPEVSKKIRDMVPENLKQDFEDIIELITAEQVEDILNNKIKITERFIRSISDPVDGDDDDSEDLDD